MQSMENLNLTVSKNLVKFRTEAGYTQLELAQKLNYSDKSISKWERGESLPDLVVLTKLSQIYNVNLDAFVSSQTSTIHKAKTSNNKTKFLIAAVSTLLVWFIASICFAVLYIIPATKGAAWLSFIYAIPVGAIVATVFSGMWGNKYTNIICTSIILWGLILSITLTFLVEDIWVLCVIGAFFEVLIILWFTLWKVLSDNKKLKKFFTKFLTKNKAHTQNNQNDTSAQNQEVDTVS